MADITKTVGIVFEGQDKVSPAIASIENSLKGISGAAATATPELEKSATAASKLGGTAVTVGDLTRAMQALAGSIVVKEFIAANVAVENFEKAMTLVTGSSQGAGDAMKFVRDISDTLGLEISGTAENFVSLSAAAKGTALEGQATRDIFESVSKAMSLLGKSSEATQGALLAIQQMISKGTVSAEELRGQLGERLPGAFQLAARAIGVTTAELGKLLEGGKITAEQLLPALAKELNATFGDTKYVTTFNAELNRLITSLKDLAVAGGEAGVFAALTDALGDITQITKTTAVELTSISGVFKALGTFLAGGGADWDGFKRALQDVSINAGIANAAIAGGINQSLAETERLARQTEIAVGEVFSGNLFEQDAAKYEQSLKDVGDAMKLLGVEPAKINADFVGAFEKIAESASTTGKTILAAFGKALPKLEGGDDYVRAMDALNKAYTDGKINAEQHAKAAGELGVALQKSVDPTNASAKAFADQEKEATKAKEAAEKYQLELEKLASNERIKLIEARVQLNVAEIEADTRRIEAAFTSIDNTVNSTGDVISEVFGLLDNFGNLDWGAIRIIEDQLEKENAIRKEAFELQKKLTEAQIKNINAQTENLLKGDALITIDGAGLQPQLEAFMWEILKTIQTRVNRDGLQLLLGLQ